MNFRINLNQIIKLDDKKLFAFDSYLFNQEISVIDMEMNGRTGKEVEIIEFYGIKVKKGIVVDILEFKCQTSKYKIVNRLKESFFDFNLNEYEKRPFFKTFANQFFNFISNSKILLWGSGYDNNAIIRTCINFNQKPLLKTIKYIDFQYCLHSFNNEFFSKNMSLQNLVDNTLDYYENNNEIDLKSLSFLKNTVNHLAKHDVYKLIFIIFTYSENLTNFKWQNYELNIRDYHQKQKLKNIKNFQK